MPTATSFDIERQIIRNTTNRLTVFRSLTVAQQAAVLIELSAYLQQNLLQQLRIGEVVDILDQLDMTHAERLLLKIRDQKRRQRIVQRLKSEIKEKLEYFLRFHPQAAMSLISVNYLFVADTTTIGAVAAVIDQHYGETGKYPEVLVHHAGELVGEIPLASLVRERNTAKVKAFVVPVTTVTYQAEVTEIISTLTTEQVKKVVVLDHDGSVLGIIYGDAARSLFATMPANSLYEFAGVDTDEKPFDSVYKKVKNRYQWLILNLGTSFLAGSVVLLFQNTLDALTILAVYIPIMAGMGGNAATQTLAIMVRGLTLGTISFKNAAPAIWREFLAGVFNGLIIGAIVSLITTAWNGDPMLGLVVALSLIGVHTVAGLAGAVVPLVMKQLGKDPAATSVIFITTCTDVSGIFFLLALASVLLV